MTAASRVMPSQVELHRLFDYVGGRLLWKIDIAKNVKAGSVAGSTSTTSYMQVSINNKIYLLHRIVYAWHYGDVPPVLDHVNGDKTDNRVENLRPATMTQNAMNRKTPTTNTSGVKGVSKRKNGAWRVFMRTGNGKNIDIQTKDFEFAEFVATEARRHYHGAFANQGARACQ